MELDDYRKDILHHIYVTGGYTNVYNLMKYLGISRVQCWHHLELLSGGTTKERYLKKVNDSTRGSRDKIIYQITTKTCTLFNNKDSYYRKQHTKEYIARSLLKNRYFSIHKDLKKIAILLHEDRMEYLYDLGFSDKQMPIKYVGNKKISTVEDTILAERDSIRIIYFDKESVTVKRQINSLYTNYGTMIASGIIPIFISVITTNQYRELEFIKEMRKRNREFYKKESIDEDLIKLYVSYLKKEAEEIKKDSELIEQNYRNGIIKKAILDRIGYTNNSLNDDDMEVIREISKNGLTGVIEKVKTLIEKESSKVIKTYFDILFRLNYHSYIIFQNRNCISNVETILDKLF